MPTLADQIAPKPQQPSGLGGWLASIGDELVGAFARYGRRSGAQRDASLELLNQASAPGTDPIMGAGQKLLGLAGLITHPLAFFPTREEWDQRLQAAGNDSRIGRSIGGFLSDLPSLIDPQMAAGGAALAAAPIVGKLGRGIGDLAGDATDAELAALRARLQAEAAQTGGAANTATRDEALQNLVGEPQRKQLVTQSYKETLPDGTTRWVPGTLRANPTTGPRFEPDMSIADIRRYIEQFGEPPPPRAKGEIVTGKRKDHYPDGTVAPVPGLLRTKRPPSLGEALQGLVGGDDAPLAAKMLNKADDVADLGKVAAVSDDLVSDYQIPDTWYHGSPADIYGPDGTGKFRLTAGETGVPALWASNDPFTAEGYSRGEIALQYDDAAGRFPLTRSWYSDRDASGGVYGLKSQAKNPLIHDAGGEKWINVKQGKIMREALAAGHDAVVFRNIADNYQNGGPTSDVIAFLDLGAMKPDRK